MPAGAGLVPSPLQVRSHHVHRQEQPLGDLGVGRPAVKQRHDLPLSFRQRAPLEPPAVAWLAKERLRRRQPRDRAPLVSAGHGYGVGMAERAAVPVSGLERCDGSAASYKRPPGFRASQLPVPRAMCRTAIASSVIS